MRAEASRCAAHLRQRYILWMYMLGRCGRENVLWRCQYVSREAEFWREHRGGVGRVTIVAEDVGGLAR